MDEGEDDEASFHGGRSRQLVYSLRPGGTA
jgi:hypothetical protein